MGLFSGGNSRSTTSSTSQQTGFSDLGDNATALAIQGSKNNITLTDNGAVGAAFNFAGKVQSDFGAVTRDLVATTSNSVGKAIQTAAESSRAESENVLIHLQKYALYGGLIWGAVQIIQIWRAK